MKLALTVDQVLTTTRSVRKRLDVSRPVSRAEIEECLEIALQAPNGSNRNDWHWVLVDDPKLIAKIAGIYGEILKQVSSGNSSYVANLPKLPRAELVMESAMALVDILPKVPAMLIPLIVGRVDGRKPVEQAGMWGSVVQAVWSFFLACVSAAWAVLGPPSVSSVRKRSPNSWASHLISTRKWACSQSPIRSEPISKRHGANR